MPFRCSPSIAGAGFGPPTRGAGSIPPSTWWSAQPWVIANPRTMGGFCGAPGRCGRPGSGRSPVSARSMLPSSSHPPLNQSARSAANCEKGPHPCSATTPCPQSTSDLGTSAPFVHSHACCSGSFGEASHVALPVRSSRPRVSSRVGALLLRSGIARLWLKSTRRLLCSARHHPGSRGERGQGIFCVAGFFFLTP